jgi:ribosome-binding factor A
LAGAKPGWWRRARSCAGLPERAVGAPSFQLSMPSLRLQRVRELLKREIGETIRREFEVTEAGLITVNDVDVSGDLHSAVVFISILGNPDQKKRGFGLLTQHRKRIQGLVGRAVILKYTPTLRFVMDDSVLRGNRVMELIEELERTTPKDPAAPEAPGASETKS